MGKRNSFWKNPVAATYFSTAPHWSKKPGSKKYGEHRDIIYKDRKGKTIGKSHIPRRRWRENVYSKKSSL